ncbi:ECF transporter S component [Oscillospiraceae bacterium OttesenSCG-928-F05]|nr:ECF transporter S component [Oscillospiraceae bacterium OttesenSCG-928-F05]
MGKRRALFFIGLGVIGVSVALAFTALPVYGAVTGALLGLLLVFIGAFESGEVLVGRMVLIATLAALASVGRILFGGMPSGVQPASFVIITAGMAAGPMAGMMTGAVTAFGSNLILGQGPWTVFQMLLWALMGLSAGAGRKLLGRYRPLAVLFGVAWGFLFGWGMNLWDMLFFAEEGGFIGLFLVKAAASLPSDLAHGLSNGGLLAVCGGLLLRGIGRVAKKYGLE